MFLGCSAIFTLQLAPSAIGAVVRCNSAIRATTFVSHTTFWASIPSSDVVSAGSLSTTVHTLDEGTSQAKLLSVFALSDVMRDAADRGVPRGLVLEQHSPNPFNPTTVIRYRIPPTSHVRLTLYTPVGQEVRSLADREEVAGYHEVRIDATGFTSGVEVCGLQSGESVRSRTLLLLK